MVDGCPDLNLTRECALQLQFPSHPMYMLVVDGLQSQEYVPEHETHPQDDPSWWAHPPGHPPQLRTQA
jgi:hypothetical protein